MALTPENRAAADALARHLANNGYDLAALQDPDMAEHERESLAEQAKRTLSSSLLGATLMTGGIGGGALAIESGRSSEVVVAASLVSFTTEMSDTPNFTPTETSGIEISANPEVNPIIPSITIPEATRKNPFAIPHDDPPFAQTTIIIPTEIAHPKKPESSPKKPVTTNPDTSKDKPKETVEKSSQTFPTVKGEQVPKTVDGFRYYNQHDERWAGKSYNPPGIRGRTMSGSGCGPTSIAMVIASMADKHVSPYDISRQIVAAGLRPDGGTDHDAFTVIPKRYGLKAEFISPNKEAIDQAIADGAMVIVNGKDTDPDSPGTTGGHIYVIARDLGKNYKILDPNTYWKTKKPYSKSRIIDPATVAVAVYPPAGKSRPETPKPAPQVKEAPAPQPEVKPEPEAVIEPAGLFTANAAAETFGAIAVSDTVTTEDTAPIPEIINTPDVDSPISEEPEEQAPAPPQETKTPPKPEAETHSHKPGEYKITAKDEQALEAMIDLGGDWTNRGIAIQHLMREGLTPAQAAGVIGNFMIESNDGTGPDVNPRSRQLHGGPGRGIAQWTAKTHKYPKGGRWDTDPVNVLDFAKQRGLDPLELKTQLKFVVYEGRDSDTMWNRMWQAVAAKDNPRAAAVAFEQSYEGASAPAHGARANAAVKVYQKFTSLRAGL